MSTSNQNDTGEGNTQASAESSHPIGPTSTEGVEAGDLPNDGRGGVETDPHHQLSRHVPQHTGEVQGSDTVTDIGLTGHPDIREADEENFIGRHGGISRAKRMKAEG